MSYNAKMTGMAFWGLLFSGLIQVVAWALLVRFLPAGWWITVINVLGFFITIMFIGLGTWRTLKMIMPSLLAFFIGLVIWFVVIEEHQTTR